ncbi:MAG TPA: type II secretion system F family protein [Terriglobia bacterium]|nr:type II secretion system F family protein [Terriglobia bacterium]
MSLPVLLFLVLVPVLFGIVILVMRPTKAEKSVQERLTMIEKSSLGVTTADEDVGDILKKESLSDVPWMDEVLQMLPFSQRLQRLLSQADSSWTVGKLMFGSVLLALVVFWIATFKAPTLPLAVAAGFVGGVIPYIYLVGKRAARLRRFEELLPDAIDLMSRGLKAGHAVNSAIEMVAQEVPDPVGTEFRRVFEEQNFGLPLREALINLAQRVPLQDVNFLVTAMLVQRETGGNLAEILDKTTVIIRERFRLKGQLRIYTAQGRLTGWILTALPIGMFFILDFLNPDYEGIMLKDPLGQKLLYLGLILMAVGWYAIRKVIDIKV